MPMTPDQMYRAITTNLASKTGRSLEDWVELVRAEGPATHKERVAWLKSQHGLGHSTASIIAGEAAKPADYVPQTPEQMVEAQYAASKAGLRPIYDRLARAVQELGPDARLDPRQSYVSLIRRRQFGIIQASTRSRVDLGLRLPGGEPTGRLAPAGSFGSGSTTHRVALSSPEEVDAEVLGWLRAAYEADA